MVIPLGSGLFIMLVPPTTAWYQDLAGVIAYAAIVVMLFGGFVSSALLGRNALWEHVPTSPRGDQLVLQVDYKGRLSDRVAPGHDIGCVSRTAQVAGLTIRHARKAAVRPHGPPSNSARKLALERSLSYVASFWERATEKGKWQLMYAGIVTDSE